MPTADYRILAINPGSTSTKFGVYAKGELAKVWTLQHSKEDLAPFAGQSIMAQEDYRLAMLLDTLKDEGIDVASFDAIVGRGGLLRPMSSGTYEVNDVMLDELRRAPRGEHASNLGAILAQKLADMAGVHAYVVDPVAVNERSAVARMSGSPLFERGPFCHALNSKAVAKRYAREVGRTYKDLRLVVAHLGGGVCISAHREGLMFDTTDAAQDGPFSPERTGALPSLQLVDACYSGKYGYKEMRGMVQGNGGLYAYLGTKDLREVEARIKAGDAEAKLAFDAMAYQIGKCIASMAAALEGDLDAIILTGGMAYSERLVAAVTDMISWIGEIIVYPGEEELTALSEGVVRVLSKEETARQLEPEMPVREVALA